MMYALIKDTLAAFDMIEGTEVEFRVPLPQHVFHNVHAYFKQTKEGKYSESKICYADATDLRCVDDIWQRKRIVTRMPLRALRHMSLCIAVESPTCAPSVPHDWQNCVRRRWTYQYDQWNVMFTNSKRGANVEIEFMGSLSDLQQSARAQEDLCGLPPALNDVVACLSFVNCGKSVHWYSDTLPFVRVQQSSCRVTRQQCNNLLSLMNKNQPISMTRKIVVPERPLVSAKCDGVRMVLDCNAKNTFGVCRKGKMWFIPCLQASSMVLDCEYVQHLNKFIAFDIFELNGKKLTCNYSDRLNILATVTLPNILRASIFVKTVYPPCALSQEWFNKQHDADGVIIHSGSSFLNDYGKMYKWKPEHTVDLYVGKNNVLMDGSFTPFMKTAADHGQHLKKGDVWECTFEPDNESVKPRLRRNDKSKANARHVCREIRKAHQAALSIDEVRELLQTCQNERPCKRAKKNA